MRAYKLTFNDDTIRFIDAYYIDWSSDRVISLEKGNEQKVYFHVKEVKEIEEYDEKN